MWKFKIILITLLIFIPDFTRTYVATAIHSFLILKSSRYLNFCSEFIFLYFLFLFYFWLLNFFYFRVSWGMLHRIRCVRFLFDWINLFECDLRLFRSSFMDLHIRRLLSKFGILQFILLFDFHDSIGKLQILSIQALKSRAF